MKRLIWALLALSIGSAQAGTLIDLPGAELVPGRYIVVLEDGAAAGDVPALAEELRGLFGGRIERTYQHALQGFAIAINSVGAAALAEDSRVAYVQPDSIARASATTQNGATWGIDRVDQRDLPLSGTYVYDRAGNGVHAYVIDTGLNSSHAEFSGRVGNGFNAVLDLGVLLGPIDCNGHGTHVAGTVGGTLYGVAKQVTIHPVRVLGCLGTGLNSDVIAGVDWVTGNHQSPAVANMSLGGGANQAVDDAVTASIAAGVFYALAAGNDSDDACNYSPARTTDAFTVGSTDNADRMSSFSNYGECVDIFAPGSSITSAFYVGNSGTQVLSGTSMASPHVAGAAALVLDQDPSLSPAEVSQTLLDRASVNKLSQLGPNSDNRLLYSRDVISP